MSRIKGEYIATVRFVMDFERDEKNFPLDQIRKNILDGPLTDGIRDVLNSEVFGGEEYGTLTVTQQYAEINEVDDESETENAE